MMSSVPARVLRRRDEERTGTVVAAVGAALAFFPPRVAGAAGVSIDLRLLAPRRVVSSRSAFSLASWC